MLAVVFYFSCVGLFFTANLLLPLFIALLVQESFIALRLFFYIISASFIFTCLLLSVMGRFAAMNRLHNLILIALLWLLLPIIFAVPFFDLSPLNFSDSLFETISGLTTTGATLLDNKESLPQALLFWRVQLQWLGGILILATIYTILTPLGIGGLSDTQGANIASFLTLTRLRFLARLLLLYIALTFIAFLAFLFCGLRAFYAASLAMAALSSGGFLPFDGELVNIIGNDGLFVLTCFLLLGATAIVWHIFLLPQFIFNIKTESFIVFISIFVLACFFIFFLQNAGFDILQSLLNGFFNATSLIATFGVESHSGIFSILPLPFILFVVLIGASIFSTCGGLKHARIGAMFAHSFNELDKLIFPNQVRHLSFGEHVFNLQRMQAIWSFYIMAILTLSLGTLAISFFVPSFELALRATIAVFTTAGPVYESYLEFSILAKYILMAIMILGRLDILPVVVFFSLALRKIKNA